MVQPPSRNDLTDPFGYGKGELVEKHYAPIFFDSFFGVNVGIY